MCGIVGFTGPNNSEKLDQMLTSVVHRGPDDAAKLEVDGFSLGMRRLAIIDLSENIYPVSNEDGTIKVVFNGEIYNYLSVREELKQLGHIFRTQSDSEVIVHGYEQWGEGVWQHLRGMFVIILYDGRKEEVLIARDRLGIKPLFYTEFEGRVIFASEIKAILNAWDIDRSADETSIIKFLLTRVHDDTKRTFFSNVRRLMPGHFMTLDKMGNYRIQKYWNPQPNSQFKSQKSDAEYAKDLQELFIESMRLHLITDVPLGVNLSGGLDSSAVVSVANKLLKEGTDLHTDNKLLTFSAIHPGETIDESTYIDEVLKFTGAESFKVIPDRNQFWQDIDTWLYYQEEPVISTAPFAYYTVMAEAGKHVKVLLSGQGGDELFAGYIPYFMGYVNSAKDANAFWNILRESIQGFDLYAPFIKEKIQAKLKRNSDQLNIAELLTSTELPEDVKHAHQSNLNRRLFQDLTETTVPNLLRYEDHNSMAFSIESRVPFLDHVLVEHVFNIPIEQKIKHGWNRYVYRNAMKGLMPEKIRTRRNKVGFVNSEWEWLQAEADRIREIFKSDSFQNRPYWKGNKVLAAFEDWIAGEKKGDGLMFWRILNVELWLRNFVDEFKPFPKPLVERLYNNKS